MNKLLINSSEEYNELVATYNSKGFAIYLQLLDGEIKKHYDSLFGSNVDYGAVVNKMKGLTIAKGVAYNVLKENEEKYKR
jgi:hypothetical protein